MFSKWQRWLVIGLLPIITGIVFGITRLPLVLWCGGYALFFWVNGWLREEIEDNYYINAAYTTLTVCVLTVPVFLYAGAPGGWVLYGVCIAYQSLAQFTNLDYRANPEARRDVARVWRSDKSDVMKVYGQYVLAQGHWAAIVLTLFAFLLCSAPIPYLAATYSRLFFLLLPLYTLLWHFFSRIAMWFHNVPPPVGFHEDANNILKGFWFLVYAVLRAILKVLASPFVLICYVFLCIFNFFKRVQSGGTGRLSKFFWIAVISLGVYLILSLFDVADVFPRLFGNFGGIDLDINRFLFPLLKLVFRWDYEVGPLLAILLFFVKLLLYVLALVLDLVLLLLVTVGWMLLNLLLFLLYVILVLAFELVLPIALAVGAVAFLVLYLIDSDRGFIDYFRAVILSLLPLGAVVVYFLLRTGVIPTLL